jgi:ribose-phosphate pyrophosphokinase
MPKKDDFILIAGNANLPLAKATAKFLKVPVYFPVSRFSDQEAHVQIPVNVRKKNVIIIQSTCPPDVDGAYMELFLMIDAARRASAAEISVVIPYFGYSRQDRKDRPRVPVSASLMAHLLENIGADRILTIDIHSDQEQGFSMIPWENLYASYSFVPVLKRKFKKVVVAAPDKGGVMLTSAFAKLLSAEGMAIVFKERDIKKHHHENVKTLGLIGEVENMDVVLVDDMIDTAGTICNAANAISGKGAKNVYAVATHGIFSDPALERITNSQLKKVFITDTLYLDERISKHPKIEVISVAPLLAEAIKRITTGESLSEKLILRNW